jgi:hypothetical protein
LTTLARLGGSNEGAYGTKEEIDPIKHLLFTAAGRGDLPHEHTFADIGTAAMNYGTPHTLTVNDVPVVDGSWKFPEIKKVR